MMWDLLRFVLYEMQKLWSDMTEAARIRGFSVEESARLVTYSETSEVPCGRFCLLYLCTLMRA